MKVPPLAPLALAAGVLALAGCTSSAAQDEAEPTPAAPQVATATAPTAAPLIEGDDFAFVFLLAGPNDGQLEPEALQAAREGHFGNMKRLAEEGVLLIAGPLTEPRSDTAHRGVFLFDVADVDAAREIGASDPGVEAGVFELAVLPFRSPSDLRRVLELERAALEAAEHDPQAVPADTRPYMLATADAAAALPVIERLERDGKAYFHGVFGGELEGTALVALDALRKDDALVLLDAAASATGTSVDWTLHGWFSTDRIEALATSGE